MTGKGEHAVFGNTRQYGRFIFIIVYLNVKSFVESSMNVAGLEQEQNRRKAKVKDWMTKRGQQT